MTSKWCRAVVAALAAVLAGAALAAEPTGPDQYLDWDGVKVRFVDRGQGEPVVLLHGFTMSLDSNWRMPWAGAEKPSILAALSKRFRVIAIDARGHGRTDRPHECDRYGAAMADDVLQVMDALHIRRAHLVGFSMGGTIAARLVARHPERFRSVVLLAPKVVLSEELTDGRDPLMDGIARSLEEGHGLAPLLRALTPAGAPPMTDGQVAAQNEQIMRGQDPAALACAARGVSELAIGEKELETIRVPALVMVGSSDPLLGGSQGFVRHVRGARLQVAEGANHLSLLGVPRLAGDLEAFMTAHRR